MVSRTAPPIVAFASRKGGTGKTAATVNLASALGEQGQAVLVVDIDSQANCSHWLGVGESRNLAEALVDGSQLEPVKTSVPGVDLIPSSGLALAKAEKILGGECGAEVLFRTALGKILPGPWNAVIIDTPPALGIATMNALVACRDVIIPVESSTVSLQGVAGVVQALRTVKRLNESVRIAGVLMARMDRTRLAREVLDSLAEKFGGKLIPHVIRDRVTVRESWGYRQPVTVYDPSGDAAQDFRALADWFASKYIPAAPALHDTRVTQEREAIHGSA